MIASAEINDAAVLDELRELFAEYEQALVANDVPKLQQFFWPSPHALRFGATEQLYGAKEIDEFRKNRVINFSDRTALRQEIVAFGKDVGIATLEFSVIVAGKQRHGRQSQVWVRFAELGWRIVSAHVSHKVEKPADGSQQARDYVTSASAKLGLPVAPYLDEVTRNMQVMAAVAGPLMAFELSDTTEPAPEFRP